MAGPEGGPDASSLKPVSSLRSHFENINRDQSPSEKQGRTPTRKPSPSPVSQADHARTPSRHGKESPAPPIPKNKPASTLLQPAPQDISSTLEKSPRSPARSVFPAPMLPKQTAQAPSLIIDPPLSPPRESTIPSPMSKGISDAHTKDVAKSPSPGLPIKPPTFSSRSHSPTLDIRKSPHLTASRPPSPPPPRRSIEARRDRDSRAISPAPPLSRPERPTVPSRKSWIAESALALGLKTPDVEKVSPFSSPPSSGTASVDSTSPPLLPARPAQIRPQSQIEPLARTKQVMAEFEPPPVHHSIASRQRDKEAEIVSNGRNLTRQSTIEDDRPALPVRQNTIPTNSEMPPPPRPPRPSPAVAPTESMARRHVSTPVQQQQPPPQRLPGRAKTVSHRGSDLSLEAAPVSRIMATTPDHRNGDSTLVATPKISEASATTSTGFPDSSRSNRKPPYSDNGMVEIHTKYDPRIFDVCGDLVCATGHLTRVWSWADGELLMSFAHSEGVKATAVAFKPGLNVDEEGKRVWIGNNNGDLMEADIATQTLTTTKPGAHNRFEVVRIHRHFNEFWTLDVSGGLLIWGPNDDGVPNMDRLPHATYKVPRGHTFSLVVGDQLWHATGKEIRIFHPTLEGKSQFQVLLRSLFQEGAGEVISGSLVPSDADKVIFGHADGKVSIYTRKDYSCVSLLNVGSYKINSLQCIGNEMWAGFNTGKICVYDMQPTPWVVRKDWQAHENPVVKLIADRSSEYRLGKGQVISLGADNMLRAWDISLQDYRVESDYQARDAEYCDFENLNALVMTWNAGASTPNSLRYSDGDANFFQELLQGHAGPDILVFGFQELVDLEDKAATAKSLLKRKKKEAPEQQERMSHQYRDWRDFLARSLDDYMSGDLYQLLQTAHLIGLFTCIFVKADLRDRITNLNIAEVKRGLGGLHGNKGGIMVRFKIDDTSLCFTNCHLAAGQSQAQSRHADIAAILEATVLPIERDPEKRIDNYVGGGDGTMIFDHELCILNGDLNYRIDTMSRDTVVMAVKQQNLQKLLERDQLLVARRRNPGFKLRAFEELPITFAPTYKYDVGTDHYDSSEKKRSPAWCDRLLYRADRQRIQQLDYRRHEVRVSDHRPVTGRFRLTVKKIDPAKRATTWKECTQRFEKARAKEVKENMLFYLTHVIGYDPLTSEKLATERASKKRRKSPEKNWRDDM